jgi:DNA replication and repair protein RecF
VLVTGSNGAGKTNLLEALHVGTQGFSPRARSDAQLVRLGAAQGRVRLLGTNDESPVEAEVVLEPASTRRARLNGELLRSAEQLRSRLRTLVFTPDRLAVVKGGPAARRAYLDRSLARLLPGRASLPVEYAAALGQRNAALRRVAAGASTLDALTPWTQQVASLGGTLVEARREALAELGPAFAAYAERLGLKAASISYDGVAATEHELTKRLDRDVERGVTGAGPHLHDVGIAAAGKDLRRFGSQGEQRLAVLALVLAEAWVLRERSGSAPLVLLDDVLSELDASRRSALAELVSNGGQTVVTATARESLPIAATLELAIVDGRVRGA